MQGMKMNASTIARPLCLLALAIGMTLPAVPVAAQNRAPAPAPAPAPTNNAAGQALEIAPPVINLTADPGQTLRTQISLRNVSRDKLLVKSQINDFTAAGEDGTPKIILDEDKAEPSPFSMKAWINPLAELTLDPQRIRQLPVTIKVPANASPGGYYSVVRFTATAPEMKETGVSLSASLGSLILVRVNGAATEKLEIAEFFVSENAKDAESKSVFQSAPVKFTQRIRNTGNIHEQPSGQVAITDMFGKKVAAVNVNLPPRNILPASIRKFEQPLDKSVIGDKRLFGKYTAELTLTYGANKQTVTETVTFWVIPYVAIGIIIAVLIVGFFVLRIVIKNYNKRIISKAYGGRRR